MKKSKRPKAVTYQLLQPDSEIGKPMYELLNRLVRQHHNDLDRHNARIALAWCTSWKSDVDGHVTIGKCRKASDLDKELAPWDFVILLSRDFWDRATEKQRAALVDHECMHAAVKYDADGEPVVDARGRTVFRTRKHDLEEFSDVVTRHGTYKRDLEQFAKALDRARMQTGNVWVGYSSLQGRLEHAGLPVPVDRIIEWTDEERRRVLEWLNLRRELMNASTGAAVIPPAPAYVLAAVVQPSVLEPANAGAQVEVH
jgi:hypothetical protein